MHRTPREVMNCDEIHQVALSRTDSAQSALTGISALVISALKAVILYAGANLTVLKEQ